LGDKYMLLFFTMNSIRLELWLSGPGTSVSIAVFSGQSRLENPLRAMDYTQVYSLHLLSEQGRFKGFRGPLKSTKGIAKHRTRSMNHSERERERERERDHAPYQFPWRFIISVFLYIDTVVKKIEIRMPYDQTFKKSTLRREVRIIYSRI